MATKYGSFKTGLSLPNHFIANMKVITSIYLNCRPDLRDEWLTGTEVDDVSDAQVNNFNNVPFLAS